MDSKYAESQRGSGKNGTRLTEVVKQAALFETGCSGKISQSCHQSRGRSVELGHRKRGQPVKALRLVHVWHGFWNEHQGASAAGGELHLYASVLCGSQL